MGVRYILANFLTGDTIAEVPVMKGATWSLVLNKPDALACTIDFRDPDTRRLDPRSITEPRKTILLAATEDDTVLAWGQVDGKRSWDEDNQKLSITASGGWDYFNRTIIGTAAARTTALVDALYQQPNTALDVTIANVSRATIAKRLMLQRLSWPGASMPFTFYADETVSGRTVTYPFIDLKTIGTAISDLVAQNNGPDFDFMAAIRPDGLGYTYPVRAGTEATPFLGAQVGSWPMSGDASPISGLSVEDDFVDFAVAVWATSQAQDSVGKSITLASRQLNDALRASGGYPPEDLVDTSHSDVSVQSTLDDFAIEDMTQSGTYTRSLDFSVASFNQDGSAVNPRLGQYRCGDYVNLDFDANPYLTGIDPITGAAVGSLSIPTRITSISGDEAGLQAKVACQVVTS